MPPTINAYNGQVATLYAGTPVLVSAGTGTGGSVTNIANLAGLDGNKATLTQNLSGVATGEGPKYRVPFPYDASLTNARILGWLFAMRRGRITAVGGATALGYRLFNIRLITSANSEIGETWGWHEHPVDGSVVERFTLADEYSDGEPGFPDGFTLMNGNVNPASPAVAQQAHTFGTWGGVNLFTSKVTATNEGSTTSQSWEIDTLEASVAYTPVNPGTTIRNLTVNAEAAASVSGATVGVAADSNWGTERAWISPANARVDDLSRASCYTESDGVSVTETFCQTQFLRQRISAGGVGSTAGLVGKELRIPVKCCVDALAGGFTGPTPPYGPDKYPWASVGEAVIQDLDGNVLRKASDNWLYGLNTWKLIPQAYTSYSDIERMLDVCIDISTLTQAQLADMDTRGFRVAIRFNLYAPRNDVANGDPTGVVVNSFSRTGDTPTISFVAATTETRDDRTGRLDRRQR